MEERYETIKDIGSGNFGVAKLVRERQSGKLYAIKVIERGLKVCCFVFVFHFISQPLHVVFVLGCLRTNVIYIHVCYLVLWIVLG